MAFTFTFINLFLNGIYLFAPLVLSITLTIACIGFIAGRIESWPFPKALYWSFITATTVGYGDIRPTHTVSKVLSILIAILGLILAGIIVAIAVRSATFAFTDHVGIDRVKEIIR